MNNQQKIERLERDGWTVVEQKYRTIKYIANRFKKTMYGKNIYTLFKSIYGY